MVNLVAQMLQANPGWLILACTELMSMTKSYCSVSYDNYVVLNTIILMTKDTNRFKEVNNIYGQDKSLKH